MPAPTGIMSTDNGSGITKPEKGRTFMSKVKNEFPRTFLLLPAAVFPYVPPVCLWILMHADRIMETVFQSNGFLLLGACLVLLLIALVCAVVYFVCSIRGRWDALALAKTALVIKLIQIPAYILAFILGAVCALSVFTVPFTVAFLVFDGVSLLMTALAAISSVTAAVREGKTTLRRSVWVILLQFVFCADVVAAAVFYQKLKNGGLLPAA